MKSHGKSQQHGAILLALLLLFTMIGLSLLIRGLSPVEAKTARDRQTALALASAKEAIISFVASSTTLPGRLPCPEDTSLIDGVNEGNQQSSCNSATERIGRLPWRTLKASQLRDGYQEPLWYAISPNFRNAPINSTTLGQLSIDAEPGTYAALIVAPGPPLAGQSRGTVSVASPPQAANYLDGTNADGDNSFSAAGTSINDRIIGITVAELMAPVAKRALAEIRGPDDSYPSTPSGGLRNYYSVNGAFPNADTNADGNPDGSATIGGVPYSALTPVTWLFDNGWYSLLSYELVNTACVRLSLTGVATLYAVPCMASPCPTNACP